MFRIALAALPLVWGGIAHANPGADIGNELSKQAKIYHATGEQTVKGYTVDRGIKRYSDALPAAFSAELSKLGPSDRWLDIGAGQGEAVLDYYTFEYDKKYYAGVERKGRKAQAVAMSIEDRRTPRWQQTAAEIGTNRVQYFSGSTLREYSLDEIGRFQIITDVIGGFSYTDNLSLFMEKVMAFLAVDGSFFTVLQDVQWESGANKPHYEGADFLTKIRGADGSDLKVCTWLKQITCAQVTCETRPEWQPPMEAFHVRKTCSEVSVPKLSPVSYEAGTPPERRFAIR